MAMTEASTLKVTHTGTNPSQWCLTAVIRRRCLHRATSAPHIHTHYYSVLLIFKVFFIYFLLLFFFLSLLSVLFFSFIPPFFFLISVSSTLYHLSMRVFVMSIDSNFVLSLLRESW